MAALQKFRFAASYASWADSHCYNAHCCQSKSILTDSLLIANEFVRIYSISKFAIAMRCITQQDRWPFTGSICSSSKVSRQLAGTVPRPRSVGSVGQSAASTFRVGQSAASSAMPSTWVLASAGSNIYICIWGRLRSQRQKGISCASHSWSWGPFREIWRRGCYLKQQRE